MTVTGTRVRGPIERPRVRRLGTRIVPPLGPVERWFLLTCARRELDQQGAARAGSILQGVEGPLAWDAVLFHARLHSVAPLLHHHLRRLESREAVPARARAELLRLYHRTAYQNRILAEENRRLLEGFDAAGVPAIVQKGICLAERVYGGLARRPLIDLVFLVPESRFRVARQLLLSGGYRPHAPPHPLEAAVRWSCPQFTGTAERGMRVVAILQSNLMNWPRIHRFHPEPLWERSRAATVTGAPARLLAPTDLLLYLCLQADNQGFFNGAAIERWDPAKLVLTEWTNNRLIRFADIAAVVHHYGDRIEWPQVVARAKDCGVEGAVGDSLRLAEALLSPGIAGWILEALSTHRPHGVRCWIHRAVAAAPVASRSLPLPARTARRIWFGASPGMQCHFGRLLAFVEYAFPSPTALRHCRFPRWPAAWLPPGYAIHSLHAVVRALAAFMPGWILSVFRRQVRRGRRRARRLLDVFLRAFRKAGEASTRA